jgi:phosphonate transport system substrate-binding protein
MSREDDLITVGAVAYHPRVVTIWEAFRAYFADAGAPTDYVLYSNYERLVEAVLGGEVEIGWNTNTAFVALERRLGREARILGMRDLDANFASVLVTRRGEAFADPRELAGRRLALGSRDSGHAAILPLHYLREQGLDAAAACELVRFDTDLGTHGDTGDSELRVVEAVAGGRADAGALGDATWARLRAEGLPVAAELELAWRSPTYCHCNFTALPSLDAARAQRWQAALLAMDHDDPAMRQPMDLEGVRRWLPGDRDGYASLIAAAERLGLGPRVPSEELAQRKPSPWARLSRARSSTGDVAR